MYINDSLRKTKKNLEKENVRMDEKNNQFKENKNHGEHRNGRKSQYKNSNSKGGDEPNQFISKK